MKVISVSNFDDEGPHGDQYLIASNMSEHDAIEYVDFLVEKRCSPDSSRYYRAVADDYVLRKFKP